VEQKVLDEVLREWERWAGELLESHISYPVLSFFVPNIVISRGWRAYHMLDVTSLVLTGIEGLHPGRRNLRLPWRGTRQWTWPGSECKIRSCAPERLTDADQTTVRESLTAAGLNYEVMNMRETSWQSYVPCMNLCAFDRAQSHANASFVEVRKEDARQLAGGPWDRLIQARDWAR